jgi:predicted outer membrane repeat protein
VDLAGLIYTLILSEGIFALTNLVFSNLTRASEVTLRGDGNVTLLPSPTAHGGRRVQDSRSGPQALLRIQPGAPLVRLYSLNIRASNAAPAVEGRGSTVHIENCSFVSNNGSAIVVVGHPPSGLVHVTIRSCVFRGNGQSDASGGAIRVDGPSRGTTVVIDSSSFTANRAHQGGALWVGGRALVQVLRCLFESNTATDRGGALFVNGNALVAAGSGTLLAHNVANDGRSAFLSDQGSAAYVLCGCEGSNAS